MELVRIDTATINAAAKDSGITPEQYIAWSKSFFAGRKVYAHFERFEKNGTVSVFSVRYGVRTLI